MITLKVEMADTPSLQEKGLMFRKSLEDNAGMLFKFSNPSVLKFWGMNTYIPLDIAFVSPENKIVKIDHIKPYCLSGVSSDMDCHLAIEANMNFFSKNDIMIGDKVDIEKDDEGFYSVSFKKDKGLEKK